MMVLTSRRLLWVGGNLLAAVFFPLAFGWWLNREIRGSDAPLPEGFTLTGIVAAFAGAWLMFLLMLNVSVALFFWLKRRP